jgi:integrase
MTRRPGLTLQRNTYFVRVVVPADARRVIGKRELIQSLQTGDYSEAAKRWASVYKAFKLQIARARAAGKIAELDLQPARIALANWAVEAGQRPIDLDDREPAETPWLTTKSIADYERAWKDPDGWEAIGDFDARAAEMLTKGGLSTRIGDPIIAALRPEIALHLMYAERHTEMRRLVTLRERLLEAARHVDLDDVGATAKRPSSALPAPSETLREVFDDWASTLSVSDKERGRLEHQVRRLIEFVGNKPANHLSKDEVRDFMALVARFPGRRRPSDLNAMPIQDLVERFERENAARPETEKWRTLTEETVGEWFAGYRRMFDHAIAMDRLDLNPFDKLKRHVVKGAASTKRRAYTDEEIGAIFAKPMFTGFAGDGRQGYRDQAGTTILRDSKFWLPILALLHGARLTEMAAMPLADFKCVRRTDGTEVWFFDLTHRSVKTEQSQRLVPLHPRMIGLGWLEHAAELRERGEQWLFPDLDHANKLGPGHEFSKWWGHWSSKNGFSDPTITFHSWRHTWKRRARQSPVKEEMHDVISGHKGQAVSRGYGEGADIWPLADEMARIEFPMFPPLTALT